jgi:hypothetical protein
VKNLFFAGGDYKISKDLTAQYYYGSLEDFYKQHFRGPQRVGARPADRLRAAKRSTQGGGISWRNASLRGNASSDLDENRLILSYSLPLL